MAEEDLLQRYAVAVRRYLASPAAAEVSVLAGRSFTVTPLAGGEYNLNYLLRSGKERLVFRVNMASQINRDDQIVYEYGALELLRSSGVTPIPYHVDDSRRFIDRGVAVMEYLPGRPLDYCRDLSGAARTLAAVHRTRPAAGHGLISEEQPLRLIFSECQSLLEHYFSSPLGSVPIKNLLAQILDTLELKLPEERYFQQFPWPCVVNTEVNSGNFIVNEKRGTTHLIDWEMARWGDPSTDLCHFCSPLTTLWKSDYRFSDEDRQWFLDTYRQAIGAADLDRTLEERMRIKQPFVLLRGISWSAMGWVAYQSDYQGVRHADTWRTLQRYLDYDFIRTVFASVLA